VCDNATRDKYSYRAASVSMSLTEPPGHPASAAAAAFRHRRIAAQVLPPGVKPSGAVQRSVSIF
jgi:hypothetical protein